MSHNEHDLPQGFRDPCLLAGLADDTPVAVAFSGGADSVALLSMLRHRPRLLAVHVHHNLRGAEADRDAEFCRLTAEKLGVEFLLLSTDAPALAAARGVSLETAARDARYEALVAAMRERNIPLLVTAHHADDQLETMLQHLLRGAGTRGLSGIPAVRKLADGILVARPLLAVPKAALLQYLRERGLDFVTDSTNEEPCCQRNVLRLQVLPLLSALQPDAALTAARCAEALAEDEAYLSSLAAQFLEKEGQSPSVAALAALPRPVFARVMRLWLPTVPTAKAVEALRRLVAQERQSATLCLADIRVRKQNGRLLLLPQAPADYAPYRIALHLGRNEGADGAVRCFVGQEAIGAETDGYAYTATLWLNLTALEGDLYLRPRAPGDRILQNRMHKAVRRLPELAHLPPEVRARMPLLVDEAGIVAVPFGPVRDGCGGKTAVTVCFQ